MCLATEAKKKVLSCVFIANRNVMLFTHSTSNGSLTSCELHVLELKWQAFELQA